MPRTPRRATLWRALERPVEAGLRQGRRELNETRRQLGLAPVTRLHGGLSEQLCLVGTFPQLEYPRAWPAGVHVVGPMLWEPPYDDTEPPPGDEPARAGRRLDRPGPRSRAAADRAARPRRSAGARAGGDQPQAVERPVSVPANVKLVDWISYSRTMPRCAAVISHAGHGTVVRALASGAPVLAVPHSGDMGENAARVDWAGVGVQAAMATAGPGHAAALALQRVLDPSLRRAARAGAEGVGRGQ